MTARKAAWLLFLVACGRRTDAEPTEAEVGETSARTTEHDEARARARQLIATIQDSQRRGLGQRDLAAFLSIWADDARIVEGRGPEPGPRDELVPIARIEHFWRLRGDAMDDDYDMELEYEGERADIDGARADVRWTLVQRYVHKRDKTTIRETTGERWTLRETPGGWRVVENRMWPIAYEDSVRYGFDAASWARLDAAVESAQKSGDTAALLLSLEQARRYGEGHDAAVRATAGGSDDVRLWRARATFARHLYFVEDTALALRREGELDPSVKVPAWALALAPARGEREELGTPEPSPSGEPANAGPGSPAPSGSAR